MISPSASNDDRDIKVSSPAPYADSDVTNAIRVLIVDDSSTCQRMLMKILLSKGFIVDIANNGQEAVEKLNDCNPCIYDAVTMVLPSSHSSS